MWDPVQLSHHDLRWQNLFDQQRSQIIQASEGWITAVEHVGSTAVPGIIAAPVIDMVAGVLHEDCLTPSVERLLSLQFRLMPMPGWARDGGELLIRQRSGGPTAYLYLTTFGSCLWRRLLTVRDRLRENACERHRLEEAKVHCWRTCQGQPRVYHDGKAIFFTHLEEQISASAR